MPLFFWWEEFGRIGHFENYGHVLLRVLQKCQFCFWANLWLISVTGTQSWKEMKTDNSIKDLGACLYRVYLWMNGVPVGINKCLCKVPLYMTEKVSSQLCEVMQQHVSDRREGTLNGCVQRDCVVTLTNSQSQWKTAFVLFSVAQHK